MRRQWKTRSVAVILSGILAVGAVCTSIPESKSKTVTRRAEAAEKKDVATLTINGKTTNKSKQNRFRGLGAVTCNNSSRLLLDYKEKHPKEYWEIMHWLFNKKTGAGLSHVKIELGCDANTSSGAEPATKRSKSEKANVRRGAGFLFAHDALSINPDITVDLLCWGMPAWVDKAYKKSKKEGYKARYRWYKDTIDAAYDKWGIRISYVSANRNESELEPGWTVYLAKRLAKEKKRYNYGKIKIVAADESDRMEVAAKMLKNKKYRNAVDVIGCHYNSYMNSKVKKLNKKYKKEIWYSEGASVATDSLFGVNNTEDGVSTSGTNGMLDVANRIIIGFAQSNMTLYEFQPAVASYYDGTVYYPKQLLAANSPWNGYYQASNGLVMAMHFTNFIKKGWYRVDSGSYGDGKQTNHCISKTKDDYYTATNSKTGDYSTVITNDSKKERIYNVKVSNLKKASAKVYVWETRSNASGESYDTGWLNCVKEIKPKKSGKNYTYQVCLRPYSMITLTTTTGQKSYQERKKSTGMADTSKKTALSLPYSDNFEYSARYIRRRGGTPQYTCDEDGAFEVVKLKGKNHVLKQKIGQKKIPTGWYKAPDNPVTSLGDDTWKDYTVSVDVRLAKAKKGKNYASLCARYNSCSNISGNGYWLKLKNDGVWTLTSNQGRLAKGKISGLKKGKFVNLKLEIFGNRITASINSKKVASKTVKKSPVNSGRVALGSAFYENYYDNLKVTPITGGVDHIMRVDSLDSSIQYSKSVLRQQSLSYTNYGRTVSSMTKKGDTMTYTFYGTGISLLGNNAKGPKLQITLDGKVIQKSYTVGDVESRAVFYQKTGLSNGKHTITIKLLNKEQLDLDAMEIDGGQPDGK